METFTKEDSSFHKLVQELNNSQGIKYCQQPEKGGKQS